MMTRRVSSAQMFIEFTQAQVLLRASASLWFNLVRNAGYWLRAQAVHDTEVAERRLEKVIQTIKPWSAPDAGSV